MTVLWITTSYIGWHKYPDAPDDVSYLRYPHRHKFNVRAEFNVPDTSDRYLEFHMVEKTVKDSIGIVFVSHGMLDDNGNPIDVGSCEHQAKLFGEEIHRIYPELTSVSVDEDGECGAIWSTD